MSLEHSGKVETTMICMYYRNILEELASTICTIRILWEHWNKHGYCWNIPEVLKSNMM